MRREAKKTCKQSAKKLSRILQQDATRSKSNCNRDAKKKK